MTLQAERPDVDHQEEWLRCKTSFLHFLTEYVYILEPPPGGGIIKFSSWPHLLDLIYYLLSERLIVVLKARQLGVSWLLAAYALWVVMFQKGAVVLMLSKGQVDARDLLKKSSFVYSQLPEWMQLTTDPDNTEELGFPAMMSRIVALPSTKNAGRSITATVVIADEEDFHPYAEDNYGSVKPTIDAGGQFIAVSTIDKTNLKSTFRSLYTQARAGANNFVARFYGWASRPGRTEEWFEGKRKEFSGTPHLLEQEYPASEEEALAPSKALAAFNMESLKAMQEEVRAPIEVFGPVRIYQRPIVGRSYVEGTDTSHGVGADDCVTVVMDRQTGMVVADIHSNVMSPEELAHWSFELHILYHKALWGIEDNDWGVLVVAIALQLGCTNLFYQDWLKDQTKSTKAGWHTGPGPTGTRWLLWGDLQVAVDKRGIVIPSKEGLGQFFTVIRNPEKQGRIEGMAGSHDDYPLACGIAIQMLKFKGQGSGKGPSQRHY